jgi:nitrate reductase NapD
MNISSAIVHIRTGRIEDVCSRLEKISGIEVHAADEDGRCIVSIESAGDHDTADLFEGILRLDGVLSASLVYSHFESDPDGEIQLASGPVATPH